MVVQDCLAEGQSEILNYLHAGCRHGSELLILKPFGTGGPPLDDSTPWQISRMFACLAAITVKTVCSTILVVMFLVMRLHSTASWPGNPTGLKIQAWFSFAAPRNDGT